LRYTDEIGSIMKSPPGMGPHLVLRQGMKGIDNIPVDTDDDDTVNSDDKKPAALPSSTVATADGSAVSPPLPDTPIRGLSWASVAARASPVARATSPATAILEIEDERKHVPSSSTSAMVKLAMPSSPCPPLIRRLPRSLAERPVYNETLLGKLQTKKTASPSTPNDRKNTTKKPRIHSPEKPPSNAAAAAAAAAVLDADAVAAHDGTAAVTPVDIVVAPPSPATQLSIEEFPPLVCSETQPTDADATARNDPTPTSTTTKQPMTVKQQLMARAETRVDAKLMQMERCCACTSQAKCKSKKCQCVIAKRKCTSCLCKGCANQLPAPTASSTQQQRLTDASDEAPPATSAPVPAAGTGRAKKKTSANNPYANKQPRRGVVDATPHSTATSSGLLNTSTSVGGPVREVVVVSEEPAIGPDGAQPDESAANATPSSDSSVTSVLPEPIPFEDVVGDLPDTVPPACALKLHAVYGDYPHENPGTHLDGGIADDEFWQTSYRRLTARGPTLWRLPYGTNKKVSVPIVRALAALVNGLVDRTHNSEKYLVYWIVLLQKTRNAKDKASVNKTIAARFKDWEAGNYEKLVTAAETAIRDFTSTRTGTASPEDRAKAFHQKVIQECVGSAVKILDNRDTGGVLSPSDTDELSGKSVLEVLRDKHPEAQHPDLDDFPDYDSEEPPEQHAIRILPEDVEKAARTLSGAAGPGGVLGVSLKAALLDFGQASSNLATAFARLNRWLANCSPPWAAIRALMEGRLIALDKQPGVRPIGIKDSACRLMSKVMVELTKEEAAKACGTDQLCAGLEAGCEAACHWATMDWDKLCDTADFGSLLIDAKNAFNEVNRYLALWNIRHLWPSASRYMHNLYKHQSTLLVRDSLAGECHRLDSAEGMVQGCPMAMLGFAVGLLPMVRKLKEEAEELHLGQSFYADDGLGSGNLEALERWYDKLCDLGKPYGYIPQPAKCMIVTKFPDTARDLFVQKGFRPENIVAGARYLGGFVGDAELRKEFVREKVASLVSLLEEVANVAHLYPQSAYAALTRSVQHHWTYLQRVTSTSPDLFEDLDTVMRTHVLPALFDCRIADDDIRWKVVGLPVKRAGIGLPLPTSTAEQNHNNSATMSSFLLQVMQGDKPFNLWDHKSTVKDVRRGISLNNEDHHKAHLSSLQNRASLNEKRCLKEAEASGAWLTVAPSVRHNTILSRQEFVCAANLRYGFAPPRLPATCDGCRKAFSVNHAQECQLGGLIHQRHTELKDAIAFLAGKAASPSAVRDEPLITLDHAAVTGPDDDANNNNSDNRDRGDVMVRNFYANGKDCILDCRVVNTRSQSYLASDPINVLANAEKAKKRQYLAPCHAQRRDFVPFIASTAGCIGREGKFFMKTLAGKLAKKLNTPYAPTCGYVNAFISLALVRAVHNCCFGSRIRYKKMSRQFDPGWTDGKGMLY
jgi:hypothetical protein